MDDSGHRDNERNIPPQGQWLMQHQPAMKQIMAFMAERDAAIQERNMALSEKKAALAERDMAILQRDSAISERNNAMIERDNAIATLHYREDSMSVGNMSTRPQGCQIPPGVKHMHHPQQQMHNQSHLGEVMHTSEVIPTSPIAQEPAKSRRTKRTREEKAMTPNKKTSRSSKKVKNLNEDLNRAIGKSQEWKGEQEMNGGFDDLNRELIVSKPDWKDQNLGLNEVAFDESTMPVPVCSCTGILRSCYKWGNGGWQSSCCTPTLSMYPLPAAQNKRHGRMGGRKMSGSAFKKLLSRLAADDHDLSNPVDLRDHWARHGTNRYITIK